MSIPSPYLHGFLAAARPVDQATGNGPLPSTLPVRDAASQADVSSDPPLAEQDATRLPDPLNRFPRLLECALTNRPPDAEERWHFQWFGLFYEAPAHDAFRLRLRLPGGRLRPFQLTGLAEITQRFAGGQVVLNSRGGLDVPGVPITAACRILSETEEIGLSACRTGGNCVQAVLGGEYDCSEPEEGGLTVCLLVRALEHAVTLAPTLADLPRPCEIVFHAGGETILGSAVDALMLREAENETASLAGSGFVLTVPGAGEDGFWLAPGAVVSGCLSLLEAWRSSGSRPSRANGALVDFFRELDSGAAATLFGDTRRIPQPRAASAGAYPAPPGLVIPGARLLSGQLLALDRCCRDHGWREVRLARGHLHAVAEDGRWVEATATMARALSD